MGDPVFHQTASAAARLQTETELLLRYIFTFGITLAIFLALDAVWLAVFAGPLYRETLGVTMVDQFRIGPALGFYVLYILGILVFVVPKDEGWQTTGQTFLFGLLYGLFTYGTFDLTNLSIIQVWTPFLTFTDIAWGMAVTGIASVAGVEITAFIQEQFQIR